MMVLIFKPVRESMKKIKAATKGAIPDNQKRANVLRELLTEIGEFIQSQLVELEEESNALEARFWYVDTVFHTNSPANMLPGITLQPTGPTRASGDPNCKRSMIRL